MGYFDLNIPYLESSSSTTTTNKSTRVKIVIKAMELGYSGIAYNRTIKGVMSDHDRCSIPLLSLSSLLKLAPSLSSSIEFHRRLLGVPIASPFRQYTRLTVCADSLAQCQVLNAGNPVLKSYDIVAVRPLNQSAFDHACEKAEVDIISINFAEKVPFRLKQPMVKAAIERGVYFELTYSNLIFDVQLRRQMISNAKLLVDWSRGKNIIFSSGAPSVNELRGPNDVANLSSLLGLSMERGKAAVSKNCRTLIVNALRKKHFHKETIRVEAISSGEKFDPKKPWSGDWLKWDPISSGEGDLQLDDMAKSFAASSKVSRTAKAIDFASVIGSMPSQGFQVKDLISGTQIVSQPRDSDTKILSDAGTIEVSPAASSKVFKTAKAIDFASIIGSMPSQDFQTKDLIAGTQTVPQPQDSGKMILSAAETIEVSLAANGGSEQEGGVDLLPKTDQTSFDHAPSEHQFSGSESAGKLATSCLTETMISSEDIGTPTTTEVESRKLDVSDELFAAKETGRHDQSSQTCMSSHEEDVVLSKEIISCQTLTADVELNAACSTDDNLEAVDPCNTSDFPASENEESTGIGNSDMDLDAQKVASGEVRMEIDIKAQEETYMALDNVSLQETVTEREHLREPLDDQVVPDQNLFQESYNEAKDGTSVANRETLEKVIVEQLDEDQLREIGEGRFVANQIPILELCNELEAKDDSSIANYEVQGEIKIEEQMHGKRFKEPADGVVSDQIIFMGSCNEIQVKDDSSVGNHEGPDDVKMEEQIHGGADGEINHPKSVQCVSGKMKAKRLHHRALLFPLKRMLNPMPFKRKARKFKHKIKKLSSRSSSEGCSTTVDYYSILRFTRLLLSLLNQVG